MKKDVLLGVAILVLSLLLCACGSNSASAPESPTNDQGEVTSADVPKGEPDQDQDEEPSQAAPETEILPGEGQYDEVLASGNGYYLVSKRVENYQEAYTEYGVIDQNTNWLVPLAKDNEIATAIQELPGSTNSRLKLRAEYANDGMFVVRKQGFVIPEVSATDQIFLSYYEPGYGSCMINAETGHCYSVGAFTSKYYCGFCFYIRGNGKGLEVIRMDTNGVELVFTSDPDNIIFEKSTSGYNCFGIKDNKGYAQQFGEPSNGLIYLGQKFYDVDTAEVVIDLTEYDMYNIPGQFPLKFDDNGTFTFRFRNPARTMYEAAIDMNGDFVEEPHEV